MSSQKTLKRILSGISLSSLLLSGALQAETLDEALTYTYVANPEILAQRAYLRSVEEKITQSNAGYRPVIKGEASYGYEYERTRTSPLFSENESKPVAFGVSAVQPIFSGFATSASVKAAKALYEAESANLKTTEQNTLISAVVAYTDVIRALAVLKLNQNNETVLQRQLEYTQDRFRVGELTKTDVAQAEARHAGAVAAKISAEGDLKISYAAYRKVIGKLPDKIYEPEVPAAKLPQTLEDAIDIALKNNPSVQTAEKQAESAQNLIEAAQAGYYPSLELRAAYTNLHAGAHGTANIAGINIETGRLHDEDTTVKLVLDVPLYTAGSTSSKVRETKHTAGQARININTVKKAVTRTTTQAWENYQSVLASLTSLEEQVRASALALEGVRYEEQAGERTVLDVLNAEQELLDARVSVVTAKKNLIDAAYRLISAMGRMTPSGLGLDLARYNKAGQVKQTKSNNPVGLTEDNNPAGQTEDNNPAGQTEDNNPAGQTEDNNPAGQTEDGNSAGQTETENHEEANI